MRIALELGLSGASAPAGPLPPSPPGAMLSLSPANPVAGDLVSLTASVTGSPVPTEFDSLDLTIDGAAVRMTGAGLHRRFVARGGSLAAAASVSTSQGSASTTLNASIPAGMALGSVVGFGSSTMAGSGASVTAARALDLVADVLGAGTIRNQGLSGTVLQNSPDASGSPRANNGRDRFAAALLGGNRSDRLFLFYGANDLRYTAAPATLNLAGFITDMREILNGLLSGGYARDEIVLASPNWYPDAAYQTGSAGFTGSDRSIHESYVNACSQLAGEYGLAYADVYAAMRDLGGTALLGGDGLHCNDQGHQVIAHALLRPVLANSRAAVVPGAALMPAASSLQLNWGAVAGALRYQVEAGLAGSYGYDLSALSTGTSHDFTGVANGVYLGRIRAEFADGHGPWSFWTAAVSVSDAGQSGRTITGQDSFAAQLPGALITDLVADQGQWQRHGQSTGDAMIAGTGNALMGPASSRQFEVATLADEPLGAGVFVELDFLIRSNSTQLTTYAVARASSTELTFLAAGYNGAAWRILHYDAGGVTVLASHALTESIGATPSMRFELRAGEQRLYRDDVLLLTTTVADAALGALGDGLGLRIGAGSTAWTSASGGQLTAIRVGQLPA